MVIWAYLGLFVLAVFAVLILYFERVAYDKRTLIISSVLVFAAMALRGAFIGYETLDYQNFLTKWVDFFRENGGFAALSENIGNYNVPYLYFLALFSYSGVKDLYLIKLLSVFFDVILAWGVMRLVYIYKKTPRAVLTAFFLTLFLPTVVLNGAVWGQCDSIYASLAVWSVYFAITRRGVLSMVFMALSFSFKLQAVFVMPVFLIFLFSGRIKWRCLPAFPLTYVVCVLPAVAAGRPFLDTLTLYLSQAGSIGSGLNYNSPSVFAIIRNVENTTLFSTLGIAAAFAFLSLVYFWMYTRRGEITDRTLIALTALICIAVPFLLPHMHERYFFLADVFSLVLAIVSPLGIPAAACVSFASLLGYHAYLKMRFLLPMRYGAWALIAAIAVCAVCAALSLHVQQRKRRA